VKSEHRLMSERFEADQFQGMQVHGVLPGRLGANLGRDKAKIQQVERAFDKTSIYWGRDQSGRRLTL
jgi:hypothetical protein